MCICVCVCVHVRVCVSRCVGITKSSFFSTEVKLPAEPLDETSVAHAIAKQNSRLINRKFASLVRRACRSLRLKNINIEEVKLYIIHAFKSESLAMSALEAATTLHELFIAVGRLGLWDYLDIDLLEGIIEEFAAGDLHLQSMLEGYLQDITGFKLSTLLETYIQSIQPESDQFQLATVEELLPKREVNPNLFTSLSIKTKAKITDHSLDYVYELRKKLARFVSLPPITLLLE